jgi:hypothetical protein
VGYAQVRLDEGTQPPGGDRRTELVQGAAQQAQVHRAHHLRILAGQCREGAGPQAQLHVLPVGYQFGLETEFGVHRGHLTECGISGDVSDRLLVAPGERLPGLLGQTGGNRAAGREIAGEDIGEQVEAIRMWAAVTGRGVDEPGTPSATSGIGAAAGESGIGQNPEMETHGVGVQAGVGGDLCHLQCGATAA